MSNPYEYQPEPDEAATAPQENWEAVLGEGWDETDAADADTENVDDAEPTQAERLLELSDWDRRGLARDALADHLEQNEHDGVVYLPNVIDALPGTAGQALEAHGVPPSAYGGRMFGIALAMRPEWPVHVVTENPLDAEKEMITALAEKMGCEPPIPVSAVDEAPDSSYVLPFISSEGSAATFAERTLPDATPFNNKAVMRVLLQEVGKGDSIVPGTELFYDPEESAEDYFIRVIDAAREQAKDGNIWVKRANTASGLTTARYNSDFFDDPDHYEDIEADLRTMFHNPDSGEPDLDDIVIERDIDFGKSPTGYGDYGLRGVLTHDGQFIPFSVGRQLSNPDGEYIGMSIAQLDKEDQLRAIGMEPATLREAVRTTEALALRAHEVGGYVGPVNVDFFSRQHDADSEVLMRDFNFREGGSSFASTVSAMNGNVWPGATGVMDTELKMFATEQLEDEQLEDMVNRMYGRDVMPYATTFLRYPKVLEDGNVMYTVKVVAPRYDAVGTDAEAVSQVNDIAERLNGDTVSGVRFAAPMEAA